MYPEINALVDELHSRKMSSFLVTNAQFPDRIRCLLWALKNPALDGSARSLWLLSLVVTAMFPSWVQACFGRNYALCP